jgi:hypothetical protein
MAGLAIVSLLSIGGMTVPLHLVAPTMWTMHGDHYHGLAVLSPFFSCEVFYHSILFLATTGVN